MEAGGSQVQVQHQVYIMFEASLDFSEGLRVQHTRAGQLSGRVRAAQVCGENCKWLHALSAQPRQDDHGDLPVNRSENQ